jgi:hypothetical protein
MPTEKSCGEQDYASDAHRNQQDKSQRDGQAMPTCRNIDVCRGWVGVLIVCQPGLWHLGRLRRWCDLGVVLFVGHDHLAPSEPLVVGLGRYVKCV